MTHRLDSHQLRIARAARSLARGQSVLYHGTRYPGAILESGELRPASVGPSKICFSRSAEEATFWATLPRDEDEGRGAILVFDRVRLSNRFRLELVNDSELVDEQEEFIWNRTVPLALAMIGFLGRSSVNLVCRRIFLEV